MLCMIFSRGLEDPLQWNARPGRTVIQFVAQLIQCLLEFE